MSILDQIYKNSQSVSAELKGMNASLKTMRDKDKQEYALDHKQRKYERERDKRQGQDRRKVFDKLDKTQSDSVAKVKGQNAGKSIQAGLAQTIAKTAKELKGKGVKVEVPRGIGGTSGFRGPAPTPSRIVQPKPDTELQERVTRLETILFDSQPEARGFQSGGFTGMVPNVGQPTTGDHYYTNVEPGSYILNRNAVAGMKGFQSGGTVPVALEKGEIAMPPGSYDQKIMDFLNYEAFPRFQSGGDVKKPKKRSGNGAPSEDKVVPDGMNPLLAKAAGFQKGGKIFLHWAGSGYSGAHPNYHATVQGSGKVVKTRDYNSFGGGHTHLRNQSGIGLSLAAMAGANDRNFGSHPVKPIQYQGMAKLTAKIAKSWGWGAGDIKIQNVMTHAEAGSGKDGLLPGGDNYGPTAWGGDGARWDLWKLYEKDSNGSGGEKIRNMIRREMGGNPTVEETSVEGTGGSDALDGRGGKNVDRSLPTDGNPDPSNVRSTPQAPPEDPYAQFGVLSNFFKAVNDKVFGGENSKYGLNLLKILGVGGAGGGFGAQMPNLGADAGIDNVETRTPQGSPIGPQAAAAEVPGQVNSDEILGESAPTTPGAPVAKGQQKQTLTKKQMAALAVEAGFPSSLAKIMGAIGFGESSGRSWVVNRNRSTGDQSYGIFQINMIDNLGPARRKQFGISSNEELKDPRINAKAAYMIWKERGGGTQGLKAWGAYTNGSYKKYMQRGGVVGYQSGGMVQNMKGTMSNETLQFFQQTATEGQRMVESETPQVINMGGEGGGGQQGMTVYHTRGSNQPTGNLASRDSCPLTMYYRFHPSFNPQGMNP